MKMMKMMILNLRMYKSYRFVYSGYNMPLFCDTCIYNWILVIRYSERFHEDSQEYLSSFWNLSSYFQSFVTSLFVILQGILIFQLMIYLLRSKYLICETLKSQTINGFSEDYLDLGSY